MELASCGPWRETSTPVRAMAARNDWNGAPALSMSIGQSAGQSPMSCVRSCCGAISYVCCMIQPTRCSTNAEPRTWRHGQRPDPVPKSAPDVRHDIGELLQVCDLQTELTPLISHPGNIFSPRLNSPLPCPRWPDLHNSWHLRLQFGQFQASRVCTCSDAAFVSTVMVRGASSFWLMRCRL